MANFLSRLSHKLVNNTFVRKQHSLISETFYSIGSFFGYNTGSFSLKKLIDSFSSNPLVYMIVNKIALSLSSLDVKYYNENGDELTSSLIQELLENPNYHQSRQALINEATTYFLTSGNIYFKLLRGIGAGFELTVLDSSRVEPVFSRSGIQTKWAYLNAKNVRKEYELNEILHIKTAFGLSPLQSAWMIIEASNEILSAEASIFKNRGIIGILTNETDDPMLEPERKELQDQFNKEVGGSARFNSIKISNTKLKYIQTGMSPTDMKLLEGMLSKLRMLCAIYGMPSILFNDNESSTYNNVKEAKVQALVDVYIPTANVIYSNLSKWLSRELKVNETIKVDISSIELLKSSLNDTINTLNSLSPQVQTRVISSLTHDEVRNLIDYGGLNDSVIGSQIIGDGKPQMSNEKTN